VPGQKGLNGTPPPKQEDISVPLDPTVPSDLQDTQEVARLSALTDPILEKYVEAKKRLVDEAASPQQMPETSQDLNTIISAEMAVLDIGSGPHESTKPEPHASTSLSQMTEDTTATDSDSSGSEGWITPSNLRKQQARDQNGDVLPGKENKVMQVATITSDFAMQNVLLQMNLNLLSPSMLRVTHLKNYILRCHACFEKTKDMTKQFCPRCGKPTLTRVACSTSANGEFKIHLKKNMQWNTRGDRFSIPKPVPGASNGKVGTGKGGGKGGWGQELILAEDQKEYVQAMQGRNRKKERNLMDEDYLPGILTGERGRAGGRPKIGGGRNEREAREVDEVRIVEILYLNKDAVTPEDGTLSILTSMPYRHDPTSSKPLEVEKTQSEEGIGNGLPWGNIDNTDLPTANLKEKIYLIKPQSPTMSPVDVPPRHPPRRLSRGLELSVGSTDMTKLRTVFQRGSTISPKPFTGVLIDKTTGMSSRRESLDPMTSHRPRPRVWSRIELEPFRAQFDEWYVKGRTLLEIQQLFTACGLNLMCFVKPNSEIDVIRESPTTSHAGLEQSKFRPEESFNNFHPIGQNIDNLDGQNTEEDEGISMDHTHLAATQLSIQDVPAERVTDKGWSNQVIDSASSSKTRAQQNKGLGSYNIQPGHLSDSLTARHEETGRLEQEVDREIPVNPSAEEISHAKLKQYHHVLTQPLNRQRGREKGPLVSSENEEELETGRYLHSLQRLGPRGESFLTSGELVAAEGQIGGVKSASEKLVIEGCQRGWGIQDLLERIRPSSLQRQIKWVTNDSSGAKKNTEFILRNVTSSLSLSNISSSKGKEALGGFRYNHAEALDAARSHQSEAYQLIGHQTEHSMVLVNELKYHMLARIRLLIYKWEVPRGLGLSNTEIRSIERLQKLLQRLEIWPKVLESSGVDTNRSQARHNSTSNIPSIVFFLFNVCHIKSIRWRLVDLTEGGRGPRRRRPLTSVKRDLLSLPMIKRQNHAIPRRNLPEANVLSRISGGPDNSLALQSRKTCWKWACLDAFTLYVCNMVQAWQVYLRPRLQSGYRRIEWDCGKNMYGDFDDSCPEDTNALAGTLQQSNPGTTPRGQGDFSAPISILPVGHILQKTSSTDIQGTPSSTQNLGARNQLHAAGNNVSGVIAMKKYLELCVNTGEFHKSLGEIEITGVCSDGLLFRKIKKKYLDLRSYRASVGILDSPCSLPPEDEVTSKRYYYNPCPLKPPPIPSHVFLHYLSSSRDHPRSVWLDRLPQKLEGSMMQSTEPLPVGWGIYIIEGPNRIAMFWTIVGIVIVSIIVSTTWTVVKGDIQGGFGVGAWMVSVPNVLMVAFFLKWSGE
ncbi:MAG: hypothetical protein Q9187_000151, partial [Circinaria calcarea]